MAFGHNWKVSHDNNKAGSWECTHCKKSGFFMGIPDAMEGIPAYVKNWFYKHSTDLNMSCVEMRVIEIQES
jgi:hypothetical protein